MYLKNKPFILLFTCLITLVSKSEDIQNVDLYIVPEEQPYVYIYDKNFFGKENFDKERQKWLRDRNILRRVRPDTYPYSESNKKCSIDIPMLIKPSHYFPEVRLSEGICKVYCNENDQCYSEIEAYITQEQREEMERFNKEQQEKYNLDLDWGDDSVLSK